MVMMAFCSMFSLQCIDLIGCDYHPLREGDVASRQGLDRVGDLLLVEAAHVRDFVGQSAEIDIKRAGRVIDHDD
jgi:hypothetical protein